MDKLKTYTQAQVLALTALRSGETKLGERLKVLSGVDDLHTADVKFVLLGVPEDVGIRANLGTGGAHTAWEPTLKSFLNIQSTTKLGGDEVGLLGHLDFTKEMALADLCDLKSSAGLTSIRELVGQMDVSIAIVISQIVQANKVPIVIGGGHNNAYPILRALSEYDHQAINTINIDAHADFRALEGRHSGNGFSYAMDEGYLDKYAIVGLHENYNSQAMLDRMECKSSQIFYSFFEDYIGHHKESYMQAFDKAIHFTSGTCGLEIDVDCMASILSSGGSLTGFSTSQVREMIAQTADKKMAYLHITEGVSKMRDGQEAPLMGKLIATLISDFVKAQL